MVLISKFMCAYGSVIFYTEGGQFATSVAKP